MHPTGIFVGLSTIDIIYSVSEHPLPNRKVAAESQRIYVGGPATNAAITFAFLGGTTTLATPVGRHPLAAVIQEECNRYGVDLIDLASESQDAPPISSICVAAEGQRSVVSANTAGRTIPPAIVDRERLSGATTLMLDGHAIQACQAWAEAARSSGVPVVLDGGSWKTGTDVLIRSVDVAICSADFWPPGCTNEDDVISLLLASGVQQVAISRGAAPIRWASASGSGLIEVPKLDPVDTTGAGDILHGAFCFYHSAGCEFVEALRRASIIASESCRHQGTREWMQR